MIARVIAAEVRDGLARMPAVALLGPRQVGKTTLARAISEEAGGAATYLDLEDERDRAVLIDPRPWLDERPGLVILDEVQRIPDLFSTLRGVIDAGRQAGRRTGMFLLLGSASRDLLRQSSESLAGRIRYVELPGILVDEVSDTRRLWLRGGFPDSYLAASDRDSLQWRRDLVRSYLERDIPVLGPRIPAETLRRFWTMLAHSQGSLFNASQLARSLVISSPTVSRYLDLLVDLMLVRRLQPWAANIGKRLVRSPRVYVRDSGLVHQLLGIHDADALRSHPIVGPSWEAFVVEQLISAAAPHITPWHYRTAAGAEIDLLLEVDADTRWAIEIKLSATPRVSRGFHVACGDIEAARRIVVHSGERVFGLPGGVEALPLGDLVGQLRRLDLDGRRSG